MSRYDEKGRLGHWQYWVTRGYACGEMSGPGLVSGIDEHVNRKGAVAAGCNTSGTWHTLIPRQINCHLGGKPSTCRKGYKSRRTKRGLDDQGWGNPGVWGRRRTRGCRVVGTGIGRRRWGGGRAGWRAGGGRERQDYLAVARLDAASTRNSWGTESSSAPSAPPGTVGVKTSPPAATPSKVAVTTPAATPLWADRT